MINQSILVSEYYLLVIGGNDGNNLDKVEVLSTKGTLPDKLKSRRLSNFPVKIRAAALATLEHESLPHICGGYDGSNHLKECYVFHPQSNRWIVSGELTKGKGFSGSATHPSHGWVIAGGRNDDGYTSSAEQSQDGKTFQPFTSLPLPLFGPGFISLGKGGGRGDFFLVGGRMTSSNASKKTFIYDAGSWVEMADMPTARGGNKLSRSQKDYILYRFEIAYLTPA